jgi:hypothetical protein
MGAGWAWGSRVGPVQVEAWDAVSWSVPLRARGQCQEGFLVRSLVSALAYAGSVPVSRSLVCALACAGSVPVRGCRACVCGFLFLVL